MVEENAQTIPPGEYVSVRGLNIYYEASGDPSSAPLVLVHGGSLSSKMWAAQVPLLAPHFRVITPDNRGHGRTNNPSGELSYRLMADDLAGFIAALGLDRPLVFGYSDGGQIALELAVRHPGVSRGLIVAAAAFRLTESIRKGVEAMRATLTRPEVLAFLKSLHTWNPDPQYVPHLIDQVLGMAYTNLNYEPGDFNRISDPTLIMLGDRDGIMELAQAVDLPPLIPGAELAIVPNTTHMSALENPVFMATAIEFLMRHRDSVGLRTGAVPPASTI